MKNPEGLLFSGIFFVYCKTAPLFGRMLALANQFALANWHNHYCKTAPLSGRKLALANQFALANWHVYLL